MLWAQKNTEKKNDMEKRAQRQKKEQSKASAQTRSEVKSMTGSEKDRRLDSLWRNEG